MLSLLLASTHANFHVFFYVCSFATYKHFKQCLVRNASLSGLHPSGSSMDNMNHYEEVVQIIFGQQTQQLCNSQLHDLPQKIFSVGQQ